MESEKLAFASNEVTRIAIACLRTMALVWFAWSGTFRVSVLAWQTQPSPDPGAR